jgi:hypothetical protein
MANKKDKKIFFDSSTLISMAISCALPIFEKLKDCFEGDFYITDSVYRETIDRALQSVRFRYEGYRILKLLEKGILKQYSEKNIRPKVQNEMNLLNRIFYVYNKPLKIVQIGEVSAIVASLYEKNTWLAIDERTARMLIENLDGVNNSAASDWKEHSERLPVCIRSAELAVAAWEAGLLENLDQLYGLLWALKFSGCAITESEINSYIKMLRR